ncbi:NAD-dependent deacylase [bacterium]|nr:NAD-dependent deacylase [bacterium]
MMREECRICILTGAGISAESGVPTFRGEDGLWKRYRPEELATPDAFARNPELVWEWYRYRRGIIRGVAPNPGHYALAELERRFSAVTLITQNVDGLHRRAGSRHVLELHGNIMQDRCQRCGAVSAAADARNAEPVPRCRCGGLLRPHVVWFGEPLPQQVLADAQAAAEACDIFLAVGTSARVYPAAAFPLLAIRAGAYLVEVNTEETPLSGEANEVLTGKSGDILPMLLAGTGEQR